MINADVSHILNELTKYRQHRIMWCYIKMENRVVRLLHIFMVHNTHRRFKTVEKNRETERNAERQISFKVCFDETGQMMGNGHAEQQNGLPHREPTPESDISLSARLPVSGRPLYARLTLWSGTLWDAISPCALVLWLFFRLECQMRLRSFASPVAF